MINQQTAELVHIDLGVSFDQVIVPVRCLCRPDDAMSVLQGKLLPTPETVPFRLTRDIVDGMGITGVEGVFRRCCEETLRVLRSQQVRFM